MPIKQSIFSDKEDSLTFSSYTTIKIKFPDRRKSFIYFVLNEIYK